MGVVLRDQPEFRHPVAGYSIAGEEPQDVIVAE